MQQSENLICAESEFCHCENHSARVKIHWSAIFTLFTEWSLTAATHFGVSKNEQNKTRKQNTFWKLAIESDHSVKRVNIHFHIRVNFHSFRVIFYSFPRERTNSLQA